MNNQVNRIFLFLIIIGLIFGFKLRAQVIIDHSYKFSKTLDYITRYYVDSIDQSSLVETALVAMLKELDPHSVYIKAKDVKTMNEPLQGNFEGIGIQFDILNDTIYIVSIIPGGPAERAGIMAGDRIITVEGEDVTNKNLKTKDVKDRLLGDKGTKVSLGVKRKFQKDFINFVLVRDKVPIFSIEAAYMASPEVGYIKLIRFAATTLDEFRDAVKSLRKKGMKSMILDLRGNGGGFLNVAVELADEFLEDDKLVVFTEGEKSVKAESYSSSKGLFEKGKLVLMTDEGSASASEIICGAIQDWDRGILVGRRTFGKGLVQRPFTLPDGSVIRLTTARYYTPTGRLIQKSYKDGVLEYKNDLNNRIQNGELFYADSIKFPDSLKYQTMVKKRKVFGGGGIMPDIFVPLDTSFYTDYYRSLINQGILNDFCLEYVDDHRITLLKKYKAFSDFEKDFSISDELLNKLTEYAQKNNVEKNISEYTISKEEIRILVKAYIASDLWSSGEYFQIVNRSNNTYLSAIKVLTGSNEYEMVLK